MSLSESNPHNALVGNTDAWKRIDSVMNVLAHPVGHNAEVEEVVQEVAADLDESVQDQITEYCEEAIICIERLQCFANERRVQ